MLKTPTIARGAGLLLAALVALAPGMAAAGKKPEVVKPYAPESLYRIETDHFIIYSERIESETFKQVAAIEQFRYFMSDRLPKSIRAESEIEPKLRVFLLSNSGSLVFVAPGDFMSLGGIYFACKEGQSLFAAKGHSTLGMGKAFVDQDQGQLYLFHEYTHHLMARRGFHHYPKWYAEGLADYYSTLQYDGARVAIGGVPADRNIVLNRITWSHFENVLEADGALNGKSRDIVDEPLVFYARAWLLTHYMMSDPARHAQLEDYFARMEKGEPSTTAFEAATGIAPSRLGAILRAYSKAMPVSITDAGAPPKMSGDVTLMEDAYQDFLLPSTALDTCPAPKHGAWLLKVLKRVADPVALAELITKDTSAERKTKIEWTIKMAPEVAGNVDYKLALAYAEILFGDAIKQRAFLTSIDAKDEHYARAQYLLGRSYLSTAEAAKMAEGAADFDQAYQALKRADTATPNDAPTQFFLAKSLTFKGAAEADKTTAYALTALKLAPSVFDYAEFAAFLLVRKNDREGAVAILSGFANDPHDEEANKRVHDAIAAIQAGKTADEVWAIVHKDPPEDEDSDTDGKDKKDKKEKA